MKMKSINRRTLTTLVSGALLVGAVAGVQVNAAGAASKKTYTLKAKAVGPLVGTKYTGKFTGKPFGSCKSGGELLNANDSIYIWTCKGGKITAKGKSTLTGTIVKGTWKITKGTGKYKGITGTGKVTGDLSSQPTTVSFTGKVKY